MSTVPPEEFLEIANSASGIKGPASAAQQNRSRGWKRHEEFFGEVWYGRAGGIGRVDCYFGRGALRGPGLSANPAFKLPG